MGSTVVLEYPNGRTHRTSIAAAIKPGMEFDLFGRRWRAVGPLSESQHRTQTRWGYHGDANVILCKSIGRAEAAHNNTER